MKIISFNSYKGGACRTTTCYNTLPYLAHELGATARQPIIVVDCDLDSMGLTSIFHADNKEEDERKEKLPYSAKHLFVNDNDGINEALSSPLTDVREDEYFKYYEKVGKDLGLEEEGSVLFLGVDKLERTISDDEYDSKEKFAQYAPAGSLITALKRMSKANRPKAIVFDCASGVQMTTIAVFKYVDYSVMCMRPTLQFRIGTRDYLYSMLPGQMNSSSEEEPKIILLPTSVASAENAAGNVGYVLEQMRKDTIKEIRKNIVNYIMFESKNGELGYKLIPDMAETDCFGLPEIERFKWKECLLFKEKELTEQEKALQEQYIKLAKILARENG